MSRGHSAEDDINFLRSYANLVAAAVERLRISHEAEQAQKSLRAERKPLPRHRRERDRLCHYHLRPERADHRLESGAGAILGWEEAEILGQPTDLIFTPEDRAANVPALEMQKALSDRTCRR